jgi:hypothetical protein
MRKLSTQRAKTTIAHDFGSTKILKFGGVGASLGAEADQNFGAIKIAVVIGCNISNKIGWVIESDRLSA